VSDRPTVAIVGASQDRSKFGNISVRAHHQQGYEVFPVNPKADEIEDLTVYPSLTEIPDRLDRVSVYLPPHLTVELLDEIAEVSPDEIWLNPGSSSEAVRQRAVELGLDVTEACSIVDLGVSPQDF